MFEENEGSSYMQLNQLKMIIEDIEEKIREGGSDLESVEVSIGMDGFMSNSNMSFENVVGVGCDYNKNIFWLESPSKLYKSNHKPHLKDEVNTARQVRTLEREIQELRKHVKNGS